MPNYTISGAGNSAYNGEFIDRSTVVNGKPSYKLDGANYYLYYAYEDMMATYRWVLASYVSATIMDAWMETAYFHTNTGQATPDAGAWSVGDEMSGGTSPAPTVTEAGTRISGTITIAIADPADYVVDGYGTAAFDGDYSEDGTWMGKACYTNGSKWLFWAKIDGDPGFIYYRWSLHATKQNFDDGVDMAYWQTLWSQNVAADITPLTSTSAWGTGTGGAPAPTVTAAPTEEALDGVTVTADDGASFEESDTTDGNGDYSIDVDDGATYTVTPVLSGYSFTPTSQQIEIDGASEDGVDFEASAGGGSSVATVGGLAVASVATVGGLAVASVASINGLE